MTALKKTKIVGSLLIPTSFALIGASILVGSFLLTWGNLRDPAPGMYPGILGGLMIAFSLICIFKKIDLDFINIERKAFVRVFFILASLFFWAICMEYIGYILVTFISCAFIAQAVCSPKQWKFSLTFSVFFTFVIYLLFEKWFYLDLPRGLLGN